MIENKYNKILVFVLVALVFFAASLFMFFSGFNVHAEDISIINFNQLSPDINSSTYVKYSNALSSTYSTNSITINNNGMTSSSNYVYGVQGQNNISYTSGHKYYISFDVTCSYVGVVNLELWQSYSVIPIVNTIANETVNIRRIVTCNNTTSRRSVWYISNSNLNVNGSTTYANCMIFDLSLAFGEGLEPSTVEEVESIFPSTYYSYTLGTPVNVGYENGYNQGLDVSFNSWSYTPSVNDWQMDIWYTTGNQLTLDSDGYTKLVVPSTTYPDAGTALYFSTGINIPKDSLVTFSFTDFRCDSGSVSVCYIADTSYGTYYDRFYSLSSGQYDLNYSNQFRVTFSPLVGFWIECAEGTTIRFKGIKFTVLTYSDVLQDSYDTGYSEGFKNGQSFADNVSYNRGYADGLSMAEDSSFPVLMSSVVEAPLNAVLDIFNFEFMGYNLKNFITLALTVCIIVAVIRLFLGGK